MLQPVEAQKRQMARKPETGSRKGCMRGKGGPENASCTYKGVRQRTWGKWVAEIREPNRGARLWLGTFDSSHEAAVAYDAAAHKLYGSEAKINLPELLVKSDRSPAVSKEVSSTNSQIQNPMQGHEQSFVDVVSDQSMICDNCKAPVRGSVDVSHNEGGRIKDCETIWGHLNNLPEFDDSAIWAEVTAGIDLFNQAAIDPGLDLDDMQYPWGI